MTKRHEQAAATKELIAKTGEKLVEEKGFDNVSVEDITKACGVAKGTFYTYFKKKEELITYIRGNPFEQIADEIKKMTDRTIYEKLRHYMVRFINELEEYGIEITRQWIRNVVDLEQVKSNENGSKLDYDINMLTKILENAVETGELAEDIPIEVLTRVIISELYGMMLCWCMTNEGFLPSKWINHFCDMLIEPIVKPYMKK